jgi:hypothetical protein
MNSRHGSPAPALSAARYEFKAVADGHWLPEARMWLRLHPACFFRVHPARQVNSIYFDTLDLDSFAENLAGISERRKARLRWYGRSHRNAAGVFEVKFKRNRLGWKQSQRIEQPLDIDGSCWRDLLGILRQELSPQLRLFLAEDRVPSVLLSYQREYYQSFDGSTRVTLDSGLAAYDQRQTERPNLRFPAPMADEIVIEFKATSLNGAAVSAVIDSSPFRVTACSKYAAGISGALGY